MHRNLLSTVAAVVVSNQLAAALPAGFATFFLEGCPPGWSEIPAAQGRLLVSVTDASVAGLTINEPLGDREDRVHNHSFTGNFTLPSKHIAADGCCNTQGAASGDVPFQGITNEGASGVPFTQQFLCRLEANDTSFLPFGGIGYFDPSVESCPMNWIPYTAAAGRFIMPGYIVSGGEPVTSIDQPLSNLEDRTHTHTYSGVVTTDDVTYVGIDDCCNDSPSQAGAYTVDGSVDSASTGVPYIQLLTCMSQTPTFNTSMPNGALVFSPAIGCQTGWELATFLSGRFLVALPDGGLPGADFGASSLAPNATQVGVAAHDFAAEIQLSGTEVGLASGCCASGYAGAGSVSLESTTASAAAALPYVMISVCMQSPA